MRILQLAQWYPPIIGGEESHVAGLASGLAGRGHEVAVATLRQPGMAAFEEHDGVRVYRLPGTAQRLSSIFSDRGRRSAAPFPDPETTLALARLQGELQPEIVHAHNWLVHSWLPVKWSSRARLVVSLHDYSLVCAKKNLIRNGALCAGPGLERCLRCAGKHYGPAKGVVTVTAGFATARLERALVDLFLPVSAAVRDGVGLSVGDPRVKVVPNFVQPAPAIAPDELARLEAQLPTRPFVLYAGAFSQQKGIDILRSAFRAATLDVELVLIGYSATDAPAWLGRKQEDMHVLYNWPRAGVQAAMRRSLATVVPSVWREPCPTVVLEAMQAGSPVIASRIGGIPELVDEESGLLVQAGDASALAEALGRVAEDADLREGLRTAGRSRVTQFTAAQIVPRIEACYRSLLPGDGPAA